MKKILIIGAGRSSAYLIRYLLDRAPYENWQVIVGDKDNESAEEKLGNTSYGYAVTLNVQDENSVKGLVQGADLVVSMLPSNMHKKVALACLESRKHLLTASYVTPEIAELNEAFREKGLLLLMECGLDPGIDHMSAASEIDNIHQQSGTISLFKSFTGGLIAPESDNNPWHYKFTWNPENVVKAGRGTIKFIRNGSFKYIPYHRLFTRYEQVEVEGYGMYEGYPNRDSLRYTKDYGIEGVPTMLRGTLRGEGFCDAWNVFVQLGLTEDHYEIDHASSLTNREFINAFLPYKKDQWVEDKLAEVMELDPEGPVMEKMYWLGLFEEKPVKKENASPAAILQSILEEKWRLQEDDKDMIVMQHQLEYTLNQENVFKTFSMVTKGEDSYNTAMAKTVGITLGITSRLILQDKISRTGVCIPVYKDIYAPVLEELKDWGVNFYEKTY